MGTHDVDGAEIDHLVRGLTEPPPRAIAEVGSEVLERRPGTRWTNVRVQMPAARAVSLRTRVEAWTGRRLKPLPELARVAAMLDAVTMVRLWVGLGAFYSLSMTFWPYPKTYWWGLEAYLLSLAIMLVSGIWGARLAWDARLGASHTVALGSVVWAVALVISALPSV